MSSARGLAMLAILLHATAFARAAAEAPAPAPGPLRAEAVDINFVREAVAKFFGPVSPIDVAGAFAKLPSFKDNLQPLTSLFTPSAEAEPATAPSADSGRKKAAMQAEEDIASAVSALSSLAANDISTPPEAAHEESDGATSTGGRVARNVAGLVAAAGFGYLMAF